MIKNSVYFLELIVCAVSYLFNRKKLEGIQNESPQATVGPD